jgi:hypothetical protein
VKVLIAYNPGYSQPWSRFHRDANCSGLRKGEDANGLDYELHELEDLPETVKPCQFETCFKGYETRADLLARVHDRPVPKPRTGIQVGQEVEYRELGKAETTTIRIVPGASNPSEGELSVGTPIAKALLGHEPGEVVPIKLPNRVIRGEIVDVRD